MSLILRLDRWLRAIVSRRPPERPPNGHEPKVRRQERTVAAQQAELDMLQAEVKARLAKGR